MAQPDVTVEKRQRSVDPEVVAAVPDEAKHVIRGRLLSDDEQEFVPVDPLPVGETSVRCPVCAQDFQNGDATTFDETLGVCHEDCLGADQPASVVPADEKQSPLDQLLHSIASSQGDSNDLAVIYIKRKPDPVGTTFKSPYNGSTKTIGELPFDESFVSQAVIELTTARIHGGGYYQWQVYSGGTYKRGWSALVDDPVLPDKKEPATPERVAAPESTLPVRDNFQVFKQQAVEFAEVARAFGLSPRNARSEDSGQSGAPPADPLSSITSSVALVKSVMDLSKEMNPTPAAAGGNGERTTADSVLDFTRELGIGEVAREFLKPLAAVTGALLADSIAQSRARKAAEARAAMNIPPQPNVGPPTVQAPSQQMPGTSEPSHFAAAAGNVTRETIPVAPPPAAVLFDAQTVEFLRPMVDDMVKGNEGGVDRAVESTLGMIQLQKMFGQDAMPFVVEVVAKSGYELLAWLGDGNPEWRGLRQSREAADYIAFLDDFCEAVQEELKTAAESDGEDVSRETSVADQEYVPVDMSNLVLHDPATEAEIGSSAAEGGQDVSRETSGAESPKLETVGAETKAEAAKSRAKDKPAAKTSQ